MVVSAKRNILLLSLKKHMEIKKFSFIKDEPLMPGKPGYFDFYHKSFSPALRDMVLSDSCPHTIGLFSKWGTGKSSIIDQLEQDLKNESNMYVLIFDAWKYQEDSLRRTFLIKLEKFIRDKGYSVPENILSAFYKRKMLSVATNKEVPEETTKKTFFSRVVKIWRQYMPVIIFLVVPFLLGATFYVLADYYPENLFIKAIKNFLDTINNTAWLAAIAGIFLAPIAAKILEKITSRILESTKTYTEIRTQVEDEDRLNSPEQFETVFTDLINCIENGKLVIVFDNIDRVQGDVALKILSTIKTFLEVGKQKVIFLVPCDAGAINKQIKSFYINQASDNDDFDEAEYLKKLFNVVLYTPEFIDEDLYEYTNNLMDQTGEDMKKIIKNDVVLSIITKAFKNNPREVKQFINNLVSAVLVASKTEVAEEILSPINIGYFTKVTILKQKFPKAYQRLKENWNDPEKILDTASDQKLRDFLTLTSTTSTDDAESFVYFKKPQIELSLKDAKGIRKTLVEGNTEEFEKLALVETDKVKLVQYIARLLRKYKGQARILLLIFKTQIQGFSNLKESANNTSAYFDASISAIGIIWNDYLELPTSAIFELLPKLDINERNAVADRYISVLATEEIKIEANKAFLHNLIDEFIKYFDFFSPVQRQMIMEAIRQNLGGRNDILVKFNTLEKQKNFIAPEIFRRIIQDNITNQAIDSFMEILTSYKQFIVDNGLVQYLLQRIPQFMSVQNAETATTNSAKIKFYSNINILLAGFKNHIKDIQDNDQKEIFNNLQNAYNQSNPSDTLQPKIAITLRWMEAFTADDTVKDQCKVLIDNFVRLSSKDTLGKVFAYWKETSRPNFIRDHFDSIKKRSIQDDGVLELCYQNSNEQQKFALIQHLIINKSDHGIPFLSTLQEKFPSRQKVIEALLSKSQSLTIEQRLDIFRFLQGKIAKNDDVNLKQLAIKQFYDYLKSDDLAKVQFGASLIKEPFLSDTDEREIAKTMFEFYNSRSPSQLQHTDLPVIEHLVSIESKLQGPLKEKLVFLILSNINHDRQFEIQKPLISLIEKIKPHSDAYEKDYSDLIQRIIVWPEGDQKKQIVKGITELLKLIPGSKAKEYIAELKPLI